MPLGMCGFIELAAHQFIGKGFVLLLSSSRITKKQQKQVFQIKLRDGGARSKQTKVLATNSITMIIQGASLQFS